jgi:folate-binding protein YgfZ
MGKPINTGTLIMIAAWKAFLVETGANIENNMVIHFGHPEQELQEVAGGHILCDLSHIGLIKASGEDVADFLQSQFSNDIAHVSENHSQLSAYCNPKGRMLANFRLFKRQDDYYLRLPSEMIEVTVQRLRMYILRSRVELSVASNNRVGIGYCGPNASIKLQHQIGRIPQKVDDCIITEDIEILRIPGPDARFEIYGTIKAIQPLWEQLSVAGATPAGSTQWSLLDILSGIPTVLPQTREAFIPQMANMDLIHGLSFKKGCYPGQEIVARMRYLGTLKRRMYRLHLDTETAPQPGEEIFIKDTDRRQPIGKIVDAQRSTGGGSEALAILQINEAQNAVLQLGSQQQVNIKLGTLPYALDTA